MAPTEIDDSISIVFELVLGALLFVLFLALFIFSILHFQKKQLANRLQIFQLEKGKEILQVQSEIQDQTLQLIGRELHDNIGQLLAVARIHINWLEELKSSDEQQEHITGANSIIEQAIAGIRDLTKSLDGSFTKDFGLKESLAQELHRLDKTHKYTTELNTVGTGYPLETEREIILFRVVQEFINNTIKHSKANRIEVTISYEPHQFILLAKDNGSGFNYEAIMSRDLASSGAGLRNITNRVELIGGSCQFKTAPGSGTQIEIVLPVA